MKKPLIIAHRGAAGYRPENTMASFREALSMKADGIELDVHMDKEGHLIVCHDETVNRTTNGTGFVKDLTLKELKELDAGAWFHPDYALEKIPTLEEVLELIEGKGVSINIELKSGPIFYEGIEKEVIRLLRRFHLEEGAILSSFNHFSLVTVKQIDAKIKTAMLYMAGMVNPWEYGKSIGVDGLHPYLYSVTPPIVEGAIQKGLFVNPFTVDEEPYLKAFCQMGVSGIITNYPDRARKIIDTK